MNKIDSLHPIIQRLDQLRRSLDALQKISDTTREFSPIFREIIVQVVTQVIVIMSSSVKTTRGSLPRTIIFFHD
jgi:hypothetical protein